MAFRFGLPRNSDGISQNESHFGYKHGSSYHPSCADEEEVSPLFMRPISDREPSEQDSLRYKSESDSPEMTESGDEKPRVTDTSLSTCSTKNTTIMNKKEQSTNEYRHSVQSSGPPEVSTFKNRKHKRVQAGIEDREPNDMYCLKCNEIQSPNSIKIQMDVKQAIFLAVVLIMFTFVIFCILGCCMRLFKTTSESKLSSLFNFLFAS